MAGCSWRKEDSAPSAWLRPAEYRPSLACFSFHSRSAAGTVHKQADPPPYCLSEEQEKSAGEKSNRNYWVWSSQAGQKASWYSYTELTLQCQSILDLYEAEAKTTKNVSCECEVKKNRNGRWRDVSSADRHPALWHFCRWMYLQHCQLLQGKETDSVSSRPNGCQLCKENLCESCFKGKVFPIWT